jgi:hypothetical protein
MFSNLKYKLQSAFEVNSPMRLIGKVIGVIFFCLLVLTFFFSLSHLGPSKVNYDEIDNDKYVRTDAMLALQEKSLKLEVEFEKILSLREPNLEDIEILKQALDAQKEFLESISGYDVDGELRARVLKERYQEFASKPLFMKSQDLEAEANEESIAKNYEKAHALYTESFNFQKQINEEFSGSPYANISRATLLQRKARYLLAEPIYQRSLALEAKSKALALAKDWKQAESTLQEAMEVQLQINRKYRGTRQASALRLEVLKKELLAIQSGQANLQILALEEQANALRAQGEMLNAANCFQEAARLQKVLNSNYPESPYASSERVASFDRKCQTTQSHELGSSIERDHAHLEKLLSERRTFEAIEIIAKMGQDIQYLKDAYPRSSLYDEQLELKIRYLNLIQNDLAFIQDRVYTNLLPVPDVALWKMSKTEVGQALYAFIMGDNPSRNVGESLPVDSVSWLEAKDFCKRLTWILGRQVRLPAENEYRQALGSLRYVKLEEHAWSRVDANQVSRPVGEKVAFASGFFDLLGNVSEWLESVNSFQNENVIHIGGHAGDRLNVIFNVPIRSAPRAERNRLVGFRFVVEIAQAKSS